MYDKISCISGDNSEEVTPVPIPNTEVKFLCADDTWWATAWESRKLPVNIRFASYCESLWPHGQAVKTSPFHGGNPSSILGGVTIYAGLAELADAPDLGSGGRPWGFKSLVPHQKKHASAFFNTIGMRHHDVLK